jgi:glutamate-1-semialdehyde 2,1-aminomutase
MKKGQIWKKIKIKGQYIKKKWMEIAKKNNLKIDVFGIDSIPQFKFKNNNNLLKTYITDQMLKKNILANNMIYVSLAHKKKIINKYINELDKIFFKISNFKDIKSQIKIKEISLWKPIT